MWDTPQKLITNLFGAIMKNIKETNYSSTNIPSSDTIVKITADARRARSLYILQLIRAGLLGIKKPFEISIAELKTRLEVCGERNNYFREHGPRYQKKQQEKKVGMRPPQRS